MASHLIGITGRKRSGKDTFARRLVEEHGFTRIGFADALKNVMEELNPIVDVDTYKIGTWEREETLTRVQTIRLADLVHEVGWERVKDDYPEVRRLLQVHGVAIREHTNPDVWVDAVRRKVYCIEGPVVISDVRFPNEALWVQDGAEGQLVRVYRDGQDTRDTHISETALDDWPVDAHVPNNGTLAHLHDLADGLVEHWK